MSTGNFHNVNASRIYSVLTAYEEDLLNDETGEPTGETETVYPSEYEYDDLKDLIFERIQEDFKGCRTYRDSGQDPNECRSYPSSCIAEIGMSKRFGDVDACVSITAILRSAYYDGANLDWHIEEPDLSTEFHYSSMNKGLRAMLLPKIEKWIERSKEELSSKLENIYKDLSTPLNRVARFSNGEEMYTKV